MKSRLAPAKLPPFHALIPSAFEGNTSVGWSFAGKTREESRAKAHHPSPAGLTLMSRRTPLSHKRSRMLRTQQKAPGVRSQPCPKQVQSEAHHKSQKLPARCFSLLLGNLVSLGGQQPLLCPYAIITSTTEQSAWIQTRSLSSFPLCLPPPFPLSL